MRTCSRSLPTARSTPAGRDAAILLPFMSDDKVLRLARLVCKRDGTGALKKYLPFLRDDGLRQLMKEFVEK